MDGVHILNWSLKSWVLLPHPNILWNDQKRYMALGGAGAWRVLELLLHNISYEVWISIGAHRLSWNHYYQRSSQMGKLSVEILDSVVNYLLQSAARPMYVSLNLLVFPPMHTHFRLHHLLLALTCLHILSWKSLCHAIAGFILHRFVARARGWRHHPGLYDEMLNASFSLSSSSTGSLASSWKLNNISAESALCNFQLNFSEWGSV